MASYGSSYHLKKELVSLSNLSLITSSIAITICLTIRVAIGVLMHITIRIADVLLRFSFLRRLLGRDTCEIQFADFLIVLGHELSKQGDTQLDTLGFQNIANDLFIGLSGGLGLFGQLHNMGPVLAIVVAKQMLQHHSKLCKSVWLFQIPKLNI